MRHDEATDLLAVFALDAIDDPAEIEQLTRHLSGCADCRDELDRHRSAAAALAEGTLGAPPSLWKRIKDDIDPSQQEPSTDVIVLPTRSTSRWLAVAAIASLLAAASLGGILAAARGELAESQERLALLEQELGQQDATIEALRSNPTALAIDLARASDRTLQAALDGEIGHGDIVVDADGHGWLTDIEFDPLDDSQTYQLWAIQDGVVVSAGILGSDPSTVSFQIDPSRLDGLAITIEIAGGVVSSSNGAAAIWMADA